MWIMTAIAVVVDLIFIAVFLSFVILFLKYGFAKTVYKIGKTWLSVVCSFLLGPWLANLLQDLFIRNAITNGIYTALKDLVENNANDYNLQQLFENLPEGFTKILGNYGVNLAALEAEFGPSTYASAEILQAISERLAAPCIEIASGIIGHIVVFIVPWIVFKWLNMKIHQCRTPFFRVVDRISGFLVGVVVGCIAFVSLYIVVQTAFQVIVAFDMHSPVVEVYERSFVCRFCNQFESVVDIKNAIQGIFG